MENLFSFLTFVSVKRFLLKIGFFLGAALLFFTWCLSRADGGFDPYYLRFTSGRQSSLILGTSRAAHGLQPQVLNAALGRTDVYNYAFSLTHSPYGPTYLNSIRNKLKENKKGIFIVTVDPWSLASDRKNPNDILLFGESSLALGKISSTERKPNFNYLLKTPGNPYLKIFIKSRTMFLHDDGWLEVSIGMDSVSKSVRKKEKIDYYKEVYLPAYSFSQVRMFYLEQTVAFLKKHGNVYLVRLPVDPDILAFDHQIDPDFIYKMQLISKKKKVPYMDLSARGAEFEYIDGNHLYKNSGRKVSLIVGKWIKVNEEANRNAPH